MSFIQFSRVISSVKTRGDWSNSRESRHRLLRFFPTRKERVMLIQY